MMPMRCWYTRWQMSDALDRGELAAQRSRGHAARCAACQAFAHRLAGLDAQLALGASAARPPSAEAPARAARGRLLLAAPVALGAAAAVALLVRSAAPVDAPAPTPAPRVVVGALPDVRQVASRVSQALAKTPLETELDDLIHDGKRGVDAVLSIGGLR